MNMLELLLMLVGFLVWLNVLLMQVLRSGNLKTALIGLKGVLTSNPIDVMKAYLSYEIIRIKASAKNRGTLRSVLLHEVITDMAIALNLESLVKSYIKFMIDHDIEPGFETRNFSYFVNKFKEWGIDFNGLVIAAPFNKIGFYMNPSKAECEKALADVSGSTCDYDEHSSGWLSKAIGGYRLHSWASKC